MHNPSQPRQHGHDVHDGQAAGVDGVVVVQVLVLGEVAKGGAEGDVADGVEGEELRLLGEVDGAGLRAGGEVLGVYEGDEV